MEQNDITAPIDNAEVPVADPTNITPTVSEPAPAVQDEGPTALWDHLKDFILPDQYKVPETPDPVAVDTRSWANRKAKEAGKAFQGTGDALDAAWARVLRAEGGYTVDTGGETMYGISKNAYPHLDIKSITPEMAKTIYKRDYYDAIGGDVIANINPDLAEHVADMAFNAGPRTALKILYQSVGLSPQGKITEDLIGKLSSGDGAVVDYSRNRLAYYADLASSNPDKYGKYLNGWTNRVRNLNKELGYTKGMNDIYSAAKAGDSASLRVASTLRPLEGAFNELSDEDRKKLRVANTALAPIYSSKQSKDLSTNPTPAQANVSSLGEVLKATYKNQYYLNTEAGAKTLQREANGQAIEENIKALGDRFTAQMRSEIPIQAMKDLGDGGDYYDSAMKVVRKYFPDEKLPFSDRNSVQDLLHQNAIKIEREYGELESGNFSDSIGAAANKLLHIVAGYLPGSLAGTAVDPAGFQSLLAGALMGVATRGESILSQAAAASSSTGLIEGINQIQVQKSRGALGLEHGFKEGAINTVTAAGLAGVLQGLGAAASKMFSKSSAQAAKELATASAATKEVVKDLPDQTSKDFAKMALSDADATAKMYEYNPHGTGVAAKAQLDADIARVAEDLSTGQPLREASSPPVNVMPIDKEAEKAINAIVGKDAAKELEWFKKGYISEPITFDEGKPILFPSKDAADGYIASQPDGNFQVYKKANGTADEWYVVQQEVDAVPPSPKVSDHREAPLGKQILDEETAKIRQNIEDTLKADTDQLYADTKNRVFANQNPKVKALLESDEELVSELEDLKSVRQDMKQLKACMTGLSGE